MRDPLYWLNFGIMIVGVVATRFIIYEDSSQKRIPTIPGVGHIKIEMEINAVDANGSQWLWEAIVCQDNERLSGDEYRAYGTVRDEMKAWECAREAADDARARYAAEQMRQSKRRVDVLPL